MNPSRPRRSDESPGPDERRDPAAPDDTDPDLSAVDPKPRSESAAAGKPEAADVAAPSAAEPRSGSGEPDFKDRWLRAEADLQNFRRRAQRELEQARRDAEELVMLEMIGMLDDLDRALLAAREAGAPERWTQGLELVRQRMSEYLNRQNVVTLEPLGERFDPEFHEALLEVDPPPGAVPGSVVSVVLKGYHRASRVLRAARVVVARGPTGVAAPGAEPGSDVAGER